MGQKAGDIQDSVIFLGNRSDVERLYQAMDVFVLPSRYEGLPVVGVEAQTAGLPCIFSNAITEDVRMTESTEIRGLREPASAWAGDALRRRETARRGAAETVRRGGFDICSESKKLEAFYLRRERKR